MGNYALSCQTTQGQKMQPSLIGKSSFCLIFAAETLLD
jgi:hypothetical protein